MDGLDSLDSIAEKDKAFGDCHKQWLSDWKESKSQELESRARQLFAKNLV